MPQFTWTSRDSLQVARTGVIEAPSAAKAAAALAARAVKAQAVLPLPPASSMAHEASAPLDLSRIKPAEVLQTLREMVNLLRHGVGRQKVFTALGAGTPNPVLAEVLQDMGQRMQAGSPLFRAMAAWPALFDAVVQHLARHGEGENCLPDCIKAAHAYLEFKQAMDVLDLALQTQPKPLTQALKQELAAARLLACLAVGQRCGLPLDVNFPLAAQHCGDDTLAARALQAWQAQGFAPQASTGDNGNRAASAATLHALGGALVAAGIIQAPTWRQAAAAVAPGDLAALLQGLTQTRSARVTAGIRTLQQRWAFTWRAALSATTVLAAAILALAILS